MRAWNGEKSSGVRLGRDKRRREVEGKVEKYSRYGRERKGDMERVINAIVKRMR